MIAESAAKAPTVAASDEDVERERKAEGELATSGTVREVEVIRAVATHGSSYARIGKTGENTGA